jgi:hypothetical protein
MNRPPDDDGTLAVVGASLAVALFALLGWAAYLGWQTVTLWL